MLTSLRGASYKPSFMHARPWLTDLSGATRLLPAPWKLYSVANVARVGKKAQARAMKAWCDDAVVQKLYLTEGYLRVAVLLIRWAGRNVSCSVIALTAWLGPLLSCADPSAWTRTLLDACGLLSRLCSTRFN
jgi:hypothetical protein